MLKITLYAKNLNISGNRNQGRFGDVLRAIRRHTGHIDRKDSAGADEIRQ
jgi:hypothetical protein